jgi:hypothetical protein
VKESTHRIERAMVNSGFVRPQDRRDQLWVLCRARTSSGRCCSRYRLQASESR